MVQIVDTEDIFEIVYKYEQQHVLLGIFLFFGRGQQAVLCVVVDHGFREHLVVRVALGGRKTALHEGRYLIHVKVNVGNRFRFYMIDTLKACHDAVQQIFVVDCHKAFSLQGIKGGRVPHGIPGQMPGAVFKAAQNRIQVYYIVFKTR